MSETGRTEVLSKALTGIAAAVLLPRLPELLLISNKNGRRAVAVQAVALAVLKLRAVQKLSLLDKVPRKLVAFGAAVALLFKVVSKRLGWVEVGSLAARAAICVGSIPALSEALDGGFMSLLSGEADVPALLAMELGLCLNYNSAALVILLMLTGGEVLEEYALSRAGRTLHSLLEQSPGVANRRRPGRKGNSTVTCETVPTEKLITGDVVLVKYGEAVPVDGVIDSFAAADETCYVDESLLTGEHLRVEKRMGDSLYGGSVNKGAATWVQVTRPYKTSMVAMMKKQLQSALDNKATIELRSKQFAAVFTPVTLTAAALAWLVGYFQELGASMRWKRVLSVLMSATPCPASIGVPIAMLSGMSTCNKKFGGTIKSGNALELLAKTSAVVLDKTGTLTNGNPTVVEFEVFNEGQEEHERFSPSECLRLVASVEMFSAHPLATAICNYHSAQSAEESLYDIKDVQHKESAGISALVNGMTVSVGTLRFLQNEGLVDSFRDRETVKTESIVSYFVILDSTGEEKASGQIHFDDELRPSARSLVEKLRGLHMRIVLLSGDRSRHLKKIAETLELNEYHSCWPHEKAQHVQRLKREGETVLMIGDGSNDSAALVQADIGLAIGASNLAAESADIVLMNDDLNNVAHLIQVGRRVTSIARRTVKYGMSASLLQMMLASLGGTSPFVSACLQEGVDLLSILSLGITITAVLVCPAAYPSHGLLHITKTCLIAGSYTSGMFLYYGTGLKH